MDPAPDARGVSGSASGAALAAAKTRPHSGARAARYAARPRRARRGRVRAREGDAAGEWLGRLAEDSTAQPPSAVTLDSLCHAPHDRRGPTQATVQQLGWEAGVDRTGFGVPVEDNGEHRARHLRDQISE